MTQTSLDRCGFDDSRTPRFPRWRAAVLAQLVTSVALVLSIVVLVMAVGLQIAAAAPTAVGPSRGLPIAGLISLGLVALGGITVLIAGRGQVLRSRD